MWTRGKGRVQKGIFIVWKKRQAEDTYFCLDVNRACLEMALSITMVSEEMLGVDFQIALDYGGLAPKKTLFKAEEKRKRRWF